MDRFNLTDFKIDTILQDHHPIGTIVYFKDSSYSSVIQNKQVISFNRLSPLNGCVNDLYQIIGFGHFPTADIKDTYVHPLNNTKLKNIYTGQIVYCNAQVCLVNTNIGSNDGRNYYVNYKNEETMCKKLFKGYKVNMDLFNLKSNLGR